MNLLQGAARRVRSLLLALLKGLNIPFSIIGLIISIIALVNTPPEKRVEQFYQRTGKKTSWTLGCELNQEEWFVDANSLPVLFDYAYLCQKSLTLGILSKCRVGETDDLKVPVNSLPIFSR